MAANIEDILADIGPCLTTTLTRHLIDRGVSPVAARQRVSRARGPIRRTHGLSFPHKAQFIYHQKHFNSDRYWDALKTAIITGSPSYGPALAALVQRDGIIPKTHFGIISGAPIRQKGQISADNILERFNNVGITKEINIPGIGICVITGDKSRYGIFYSQFLKARLQTEDILLMAVRDWAKKLGLASYHSITSRDTGGEQPRVGTFHWDMTGPSYLAPLVSKTKSGNLKNGFLVCDVLLGKQIELGGMDPFLRKCRTLRSLKNVGSTLTIFIADSYSNDAFTAAREAGIVAATPTTLFGRAVAEALTALLETLSKAAAATTKPEIFDELFRKLGHIEGAANNLRGALFEFIVAHLVRTIDGGQVRINHILQDSSTGNQAEVDVILEQENQRITFIECKGRQPTNLVEEGEVRKWIEDRIPLIRKCVLAQPLWNNLQQRFQFWTCGSFSPNAREFLEQAASKTTKYEIHCKDGNGVKEYAQKLQGSSLSKTLNEHFFQHPLTKIEQKALDQRKSL